MAVLTNLTVFQRRLRRCFARSLGSLGLICSLWGGASVSAQQRATSQWTMANRALQVEGSVQRQSMQMVVNQSREITADQPFKRVRIQNPNVLKAIPLEGGNRLQISALATGVTQVDLLGANDSVHTIEVMVLGDVRELEFILRQQFPSANLQVTPVQQGCILSGFVTNAEHVNQVMSIAELFFPPAANGPAVINRINVAGVHTIQLETQVMEVSRTKLRQLGIDWAISNGDDLVAQTVGGLLQASGNNVIATGNETFTAGVVENSTQFFASIRALRENSLVKVLANPTLTAVDGRPASFNVGGEIPIVVPAGLGQVAIQYREFGTRLDYVAKVRGEGRIYLEVRPYVSEIDPSRSVQVEGIDVPGLRSRFLETGVELGAGETLVLGGLLQVRSETTNTGLPFFADLPYVGAFFRSTREERNEVELLITVTPHFAGPMAPHEVPASAPGTSSDSPTNGEFYWRGYIETPVVGGNVNPAPMGVSIRDGSAVPPNASSGPHVVPHPASRDSGPVEFNPSTLPVPEPSAMNASPEAPRLAEQTQPAPQSVPTGKNNTAYPSMQLTPPNNATAPKQGFIVR